MCVQFNWTGATYAIVCMIITAQYQIYVGTKQKELGVNSTQLLTNMVPVSAVIVLAVTPLLDNTGIFFDQPNSLVNYTFTTVSCVCLLVVVGACVCVECVCVCVCVCVYT